MSRWSNWSGRHVARPAALWHIRSEDDAAAIVAAAGASGQSLRTAGSGHSHMPLVPTEGAILDISGLSGVIETDARRRKQVLSLQSVGDTSKQPPTYRIHPYLNR